MPAWALKGSGGGGSAAEWFLQQLAVARATLPDAGFDTIIPMEFAGTLTTELADQAGATDANPGDVTGGVLVIEVGDNVETLSSARLQFVGSTNHVGELNTSPWFMAALVKISQPLDETQLADTRADAVALWSDADNFVALGINGAGSGGSLTNWVGSASLAASVTTTLGPALDSAESPVWHLFQAWRAPDGFHFALDGAEFANTIDLADGPATPARLSPTIIRFAVGDAAIVNVDKLGVFVKSPTVGEP